MTTVKRRFIAGLIDRSGSMAAIAKDVQEGWKAFLDSQREVAESMATPNTVVKTKVLLAQFDDEFEIVYGPMKIAKVPDYVLESRNSTALYDSIAKIVEAIEYNIADEMAMKGKDYEDVTLVIFTDGNENSSRSTTLPRVKALLEKFQGRGWTVLFLAANQDAVLTGSGLGISAHHSLTYSTNNSASVLRSVGVSVAASYASSTPVAFTDTERSEAVK
jgi:hypothetical protein